MCSLTTYCRLTFVSAKIVSNTHIINNSSVKFSYVCVNTCL